MQFKGKIAPVHWVGSLDKTADSKVDVWRLRSDLFVMAKLLQRKHIVHPHSALSKGLLKLSFDRGEFEVSFLNLQKLSGQPAKDLLQ